MPNCLGIYVEDNLIKYAKVSKNNENIKIESFGVKFYENLENAVKQIVEETYSFSVPISMNTSEEIYNEIQVFSLLSKKDMKNAIKTEFENICYEKDINKNIYEERYFFINTLKNQDKIKAMHIAVPKISLEQQKNRFSKYKVNSIAPISVAISNLLQTEKKGTNLIVNIEKNTVITKVINGVVAEIEILDIGAQEILDKISLKENSYAKAYEICKNSTIYTEQDLQYEENEYLQDIMPTLFQIATKVKNNVNLSMEKIDNIYITGTGAVINNIDIYFQEFFKDINCEILKPSFVSNNAKVNIKDYIEVNSAISMGLQGLEKSEVNFKGAAGSQDIFSSLNVDVSEIKTSEIAQSFSNFTEAHNKQFNFTSTILTLAVIAYFAGSIALSGLLDNKIEHANNIILDTNNKITKLQEDKRVFDDRKKIYTNLINKIQDLNNINSEDKRYKNTIPNLLNNIMTIVPKGVQLISIENTSDTHIVIVARAKELQQIAFFKTELQTEGVLEKVVTDTGKSDGTYLTVTIEGELP